MKLITPQNSFQNTNDTELLPVMFFIHGGAFYAGTQIKMGPERLGDVADIVLVAINYRVGPLGEIFYSVRHGPDQWHGRPQTFFQGRAKFSSGRGGK
jgi:carboxylesterase type B